MGIRYSVTMVSDRDIAVLRVEGDLDFDERNNFAKAIREMSGHSARQWVIDLSRITRLSSVFIGALVDCAKEAHMQGKTLSVSMPEQVARICIQSGLDKVTNLIVARDSDG